MTPQGTPKAQATARLAIARSRLALLGPAADGNGERIAYPPDVQRQRDALEARIADLELEVDEQLRLPDASELA